MKQITNDLIRSKKHGPTDAIDGAYLFKHPKIKDYRIRVVASTGMSWDHLSVSLVEVKGKKDFRVKRTPTWAEMCWVKDMFFDKEEPAFQIHPPHSEYVNMHPYCLHIWRYQLQELPRPEMILVGNESPTQMTLEGL